jgi:uncharacterized protein (TIGR02996 family)
MLEVNQHELPFLQRILAEQTNVDEKLVYSDWLQTQGDPRGQFVSDYVEAMKTMESNLFPSTEGFEESWLDLIGFSMMSKLATLEEPVTYRDQILRLLEPAIRIDTTELADTEIEIGTSKYGGHPDLPSNFAWPKGQDCDAIYNDDTKGVEELAGFLMQMNLAEAQSSSFVALPLPKSGLLSFFCYQDDDNVDCIGVQCFYHPDLGGIEWKTPPSELTDENATRGSKQIQLRECLRIPLTFETEDRSLNELIWQLSQSIVNQTLFGVRDYQTSDVHFIGIDKDDSTTVFIDVSPDISKVDLSWVEFDGDTGFK